MNVQELSKIHALSFSDGSRVWSADEIESLLKNLTVGVIEVPYGFLMYQNTGTEAEILTIAVLPEHQNKGIGSQLFAELFIRLSGENISRLILEVASGNIAARYLYSKLGFADIGFRKDYYKQTDNRKESAIVMALDLSKCNL